jgi:hypothetical protein
LPVADKALGDLWLSLYIQEHSTPLLVVTRI